MEEEWTHVVAGATRRRGGTARLAPSPLQELLIRLGQMEKSIFDTLREYIVEVPDPTKNATMEPMDRALADRIVALREEVDSLGRRVKKARKDLPEEIHKALERAVEDSVSRFSSAGTVPNGALEAADPELAEHATKREVAEKTLKSVRDHWREARASLEETEEQIRHAQEVAESTLEVLRVHGDQSLAEVEKVAAGKKSAADKTPAAAKSKRVRRRS